MNIGPNPKEVAGVLKEALDVDAARLHEKNQAPVLPWIVRHNMPQAQALNVKEALKNAGATAVLLESESRIYRATPDALAQWRAIEAGH